MAQSAPVPPVHPRRHRNEHHQIDQNNSAVGPPIAAGRFGETEWEARDV